MKKKKIIMTSIVAAILLLGLGSLAFLLLSREELIVEVNAEFDLSTLKGYTSYSDLRITYQGEEVPVEKEKITFDKLGDYKITGKGVRYKITSQDTTAPVVQLMGSLMKLQATDEVELPEVRVIDNYDENIKDYTLNVYNGDTEVAVENQAFYVPDTGDYIIRMSAVDSSDNRGKNEKSIHVTPLFDKKVKVGEVVEIKSSWISYLLPKDSNIEDYDFSFRIYRNGVLMDTAENRFTAEGNCYYNVCITAKSKINEGETYSGWIIFVEEHARILTFTTMTTDEVGNAGYNMICNPYPQVERSVKDYGDGRFVMDLNVNLADFPEKMEQILLAWPVDAWALPKDITDYDASFSLTLKGKLKANITSAEFVAGGYTNKEQNIQVKGNDGVFESTAQISTEKIAAFTEGGVTRVYYILKIPKEKLEELEVNIDNFQLTPKAPPIYTGVEYLPKEMGERVELTSDALGLAATDCLGGTVKSIEITGVKEFDASVSGKRKNFKGDALTEKGIYFVQCRIYDYYGNEGDAEMIVSIGMGVLDVKPPVISTKVTEQVVSDGTVIKLGKQGIDGYLTIEDQSSYEVRYQVYRNGKEVKAGSSFTVGKYDRYEVYITATDSSILENESTGYLIFLGSGLKGEIATMSTDEYETINYGGESQLMFNGVQKGFFYPFDAKIEEENGNRYVKLTQNKPGYGRMEILFPTKQNERGVVANFDFKVGGTLSGQLSNSTVLFEIGGETVTVADVKAGKRFTVSIPNLYNRLPDESGLRTQAVYFENCENFLKEKGLYLCVDNIQVEKVFEDLYNETNSFDTLALNKTGIVINSGNTVLKLVDRTKYELAYQVYRNGTEKVNRLNITRSGYEYYEVEISVLYKGTKQVRTKTKMTFQWDADAFITMENGEKFYHVAAANERPAYDQLLDSRDTFLMEMFPFLGELKKDARNNTYLALTPSDIRDGAALAIVNIGDASKHSENVGFTFWIEGDVSGLAGDTLLAIVGNTEIRAKDIGVQFSYLNKLSFNGCFSDPILIRNYDVLYQKGLKLCVDNVWRKKIVEENLFKGTYKVVNECNRFAVTSQSITTNNGTVLQLADSGKFELVCEIYKNGTERVGATNIYLQGNDFYSVRVSVRNKSTQKVHRTIELIFTDKTDSFSAMEEGESFWRVPASESHSVYDQFLDSEKNVQMEFYPFVGELKTENGNTYTVLKASGTAERAAISFINVKDTSAHKADVGFDFWIEGDAQGASAEDVVAVIGGQTIRVKDIGKKFYYQNRLVFDGCYSESILIENAELLETKGLELCIDNVWRAKRFNNAYATVNVCDEFSLNEKEIVTNGTQVALQLTDSSKFKLSYAVYKNGVEKTTATEIHREGTDFYNVDVTLIEKATNKAHSRFTLVFSGIVDKFLAMEDGESFNLIPSSDKNPEYCQLLDGRGTYQMSLYPFTGEWKTISGNTYMSLKVNGNGEGAALSFVSMEDASEHQADVGFTFWIEGNSAEIDAEDVVAVIGGQTVKGEDIGKKYYYQDRLTFNQSFAAGVSIGNAELLATKDLRLCVDNIWRVKVEEEGEQANVKVDVVLDAAGSNSKGGFWVTTSKPDDFYTCDSWMDKPEATTGGVYVNGILNPGCDIIKFSWGVYYIAVSDGGITAKEGTTVVLDGIYGRGSNDPKYGDNYTVKFNQAIFQYTGGSWKQLSEMPAEPGETADATIDLALDAAGSNTTNGFWVVPSNSDDFYTCDSWQDKPEAITGGVYVDGTLYPGCVIIKFSWGVYYIAVSDGGITAKEGTTVVLDGIYGRGSSDPKYGDDYTVKFNKTTFEYKSGSWKQK